MISRKHAREKAFQALYQLDINETVNYEDLFRAIEEEVDAYAHELIEGVFKYRQKIDAAISEKLEKWSFNRIGTVEKTVLRIAVYEILYIDDVPVKVSINEAVDIAKRFNEEQSGKFINGILSKFTTK
nr:transcription antitermination factor NusB [Allobacillus halotolerans]